MILSLKARQYFQMLQSKVTQGLAKSITGRPYFLEDDPVIRNYEMIRMVWRDGGSIKKACSNFSLSRTQFYEKENQFIKHGVAGLFPRISGIACTQEMENLITLINEARPSLSQQAMLRIAEALPHTRNEANLDCISEILASHGISASSQKTDKQFWSRIQRTLMELGRLTAGLKNGRNNTQRRKSFFRDDDLPHKRLELLRELAYDPSIEIKKACRRFGIAPAKLLSVGERISSIRTLGGYSGESAGKRYHEQRNRVEHHFEKAPISGLVCSDGSRRLNSSVLKIHC